MEININQLKKGDVQAWNETLSYLKNLHEKLFTQSDYKYRPEYTIQGKITIRSRCETR